MPAADEPTKDQQERHAAVEPQDAQEKLLAG
jgi:hypothetical protein